GTWQKDVIIQSDAPDTLLLEKQGNYIVSYGSKKDDYEYCVSEYLRMSVIYWDLIGQLHSMNREEILTCIQSCQHECGGISVSIGRGPHLLYTLSAVQILSMILWNMFRVYRNKMALLLEILGGKLIRDSLFVQWQLWLYWGSWMLLMWKRQLNLSCMNFDGGFGCRPGSESHAGQDSCLLLVSCTK
ncbi:hypothetical protein K5549_021419, partial [Capra hircus]